MRDNKWLVSMMVLSAGLFSFVFVVIADTNTANTAVVVSNSAPTLSVNFNNGNAITLNESTFAYATASLTATDANGCGTINHISAVAWLASTTAPASYFCANDDNNCYNVGSSTPYVTNCLASTTNACTGGVDTSVVYDCGFKLWYIAEATDSTAPTWSTSIWAVSASTSDGLATSTATNTAQVVEVNTLNALSVTNSINYGTLGAGADSGATNSTTTATSTGNIWQDANISGADMASGVNMLQGIPIYLGQHMHRVKSIKH